MATDTANRNDAYAVVARAIAFLDAHRTAQPSLEAVAAHVGLSPSHLQRLFATWAGVSPKQFLQHLTREDARRRLRREPVLDAAFASGLSGSGRLHDLMVKCDAVTPGEYRSGGAGLEIRFGDALSPFGAFFLAVTPRGVCKLAFFDDEARRAQLEEELRGEWPAAVCTPDPQLASAWLPRIFPPASRGGDLHQPLRVLMRGSPFQLKVWEALLAIPPGEVRSYADVAVAVGEPSATRAVASAIARNAIGYLIPCHRVIRSTGETGEYRWGAVRKQAMLAREAVHGE